MGFVHAWADVVMIAAVDGVSAGAVIACGDDFVPVYQDGAVLAFQAGASLGYGFGDF